MTEAASPEHPPSSMPPTKRRKLDEDTDTYFQNGDPSATNPHVPTSSTYAPKYSLEHQSERHHSPNKSEGPVVRGPQVTGDLDEVRPPRRTDPDRSPSAALDKRIQPSYASAAVAATLPDTNLDPQVDAMLGDIFASGLFERKDIDGRALEFLASVSPQLALAALNDIQRRDFSTVRNKPAFIMSIFKRVIAAGGNAAPPQAPPPGGYAPTSVPAAALAHLPPAVSDALQRVFASGVCHPSQFDDRAMDILVDLAEPDAVRALSEFAAMEPGRVRNPSAFWMGLAKKYKGHSRAPGGRMGLDSAPSGGYSSFDSGMDYRRIGTTAGGGAVGAGGGAEYSALDQRLDELAVSGSLPRGVLDDRALDALRRLPEHDALAVLAELPATARVRNMSAYVMGLCKKFATGEARSLAQRMGPYSGGGAGGYSSGGSYGGGYSGGYNATYGGGYGNTTSSSYGGTYAPTPTAAAYAAAGYGVAPANVATTYGSNIGQPDDTHSRELVEAMEAVDPVVRDRFYEMTNQGVISDTSFDARAIGALRGMRSEDAVAALNELAASEPGRIHNISAYFMGLVKKFSRPPM